MRIIGIDPSLSGTGVAASDGTDTIATKAGDPDRLDVIYTQVSLRIGGIDLAVIEDLPSHAKSAGLTGMAQGVVRLALIHADVPYVTVTPATLKTYACGKGNAPKPDMRMELYKRTGIDLSDDNQVDAIWLRHLGHALVGDPLLDLPKTHTRALDKVHMIDLPVSGAA